MNKTTTVLVQVIRNSENEVVEITTTTVSVPVMRDGEEEVVEITTTLNINPDSILVISQDIEDELEAGSYPEDLREWPAESQLMALVAVRRIACPDARQLADDELVPDLSVAPEGYRCDLREFCGKLMQFLPAANPVFRPIGIAQGLKQHPELIMAMHAIIERGLSISRSTRNGLLLSADNSAPKTGEIDTDNDNMSLSDDSDSQKT